MPLDVLRHARKLSQVRLAEIMETTQPEISKIEHRTDLYVSTLRSYIEAMGGVLEIVARFPDGNVKITQFHDADDSPFSAQSATRRVASSAESRLTRPETQRPKRR